MCFKKATRNYNIIAQTHASLRPMNQHCWQTHVVERWRDVNCSNSHNRIITVPMAPKSLLSHYLMCEFKCEYVTLLLCLIHMCTMWQLWKFLDPPLQSGFKDTGRLFQCSQAKVSTWPHSTQTALKTINLNSHVPTIHILLTVGINGLVSWMMSMSTLRQRVRGVPDWRNKLEIFFVYVVFVQGLEFQLSTNRNSLLIVQG